jgi:hypothetical protein
VDHCSNGAAMNQNVGYGKDRQAICPYDVAIWWHLAFNVEKSIFNPTYISADLVEEIQQLQRRSIIQALPDSDGGRKWLILNYFENGI